MNGIFIHQQIKALAQLGIECHIIMEYNWFPPAGFHRLHAYWREGFEKFKNIFDSFEGITIHKVPVFVKMPNRFFSEDHVERTAKAIARYIRNSPFLCDADWIYAHFLTDHAFIGTKVKALTNIRLVSIARGDDVHAWPQENPALLSVIQEVFQKTDLLLANSQKLADDANDLVAEKYRRSIEIIYNGIDLEKFYPVGEEEKITFAHKFELDERKKHVLCVATPVALKGWLVLLDAIAASKKLFEGWILLCVTVNRNQADFLDLNSEAKARGIGSFIRILGQVEHGLLADLYRSVDAFVLPSFNEGLSNAVLEAAASNLPLLITDVGGHKEIFENSKSSILVKPNDVEDLANGLNSLLNETILHSSDTRQLVANQVGTYLQNAEKLKNILIQNINSVEV